jgi:4-hydroxy-tetrahydrodipicolinate synthase
MLKPKGSWVALVTPFTDEGGVDLQGFQRLVDFHVKYGSDGLLVMGSTGESPLLSLEERQIIARETSAYAKDKIPLFVGCTCASTKETIALAEHTARHGADGILLVVPPYVAPPQAQIYEFFRDVALAVAPIPVAIYNNPARVSVNIDPDTIVRLAELDNIVADKEAMPNLKQLHSVITRTQGRINVLVCDAPGYSLILPVLAMGGHGTANVSGNVIPEEMAKMSQPWTSWEDVRRTREFYFKYFPVIEGCYSAVNPVGVKEAMNYMGLPAGPLRRPLAPMQAEKFSPFRETLDRLGLVEKYGQRTQSFSRPHGTPIRSSSPL